MIEGMTKAGGESIESILSDPESVPGRLLAILHRVQHTYGYISREAVEAIARHLHMTPVQVYAFVSFYSELRFTTPGERQVVLCDGPTCHLRGMDEIRHVFEEKLGISTGEVTPDGKVELKVTQCSGLCHMAPLLSVDDTLHSQLKGSDVDEILKEIAANPGSSSCLEGGEGTPDE